MRGQSGAGERAAQRGRTATAERAAVLALMIASSLVGVFFWRPVLVLAKPDEHAHLLYVHEVQKGAFLPRPSPAPNGIWRVDERYQPPLYYWLTALVTFPSRSSDPRRWIDPNPFFLYRAPQGNAARALPRRVGAPFLFALRAASWLLGLLVLAGTYRAAKPLFSPPARVAAVAAVGLLPSFLFLQSAANNSALAAVWAALAFAELLVMWRHGVTPRRALRLGLWLAVGLWTRADALLLYPAVALLALREWKDRRRGYRLLIGAGIAGALVAAPVYARNWWQHRDVIGASFLAPRPEPLAWGTFFSLELQRLFKTAVISVGEGFALAPDIYYTPVMALLIVALLGLVNGVRRAADRPALGFLAASFLPVFGAGLLASRWFYMDAPRYWLTYATPAVLLAVAGYTRAWPRWARGAALAGWVIVWWLVAMLTVVRVVWPLYVPRPASPAAVPLAVFGKQVVLHRAAVQTLPDGLEISLTWEATGPVAENWAVFVHAVAPDGRIVAQEDTHPLYGAYPTSWWKPGMAFVDPHRIVWPEAYEGPVALYVGLYRPDTGARLPARRPDGARWPNDAVFIGRANGSSEIGD